MDGIKHFEMMPLRFKGLKSPLRHSIHISVSLSALTEGDPCK